MDNGSSISERLNAIKDCHDAGIYTVLFMSPIFPSITEWQEIIDRTKDIVSEYWFENLNLRGDYKHNILSYINDNYPEFNEEYNKIYLQKDMTYWRTLANSIETYCDENKINYIYFFDHDKLVREKLDKSIIK